MKRIFVVIFSVLLLFCGCTRPVVATITTTTEPVNKEEKVKSVWIAYYELSELIRDSEQDFKDVISDRFAQLKDLGFNTVTVQVRPCGDAFYISDYFPSSKYCFGKQGTMMPYDPLSVMCSVASEQGLNIEAWVNPYRVSQDAKMDALCDTNIAKKWYYSKNKKKNVIVTKDSIYFNPASDEVTELIVNGVIEIVKNYSISAIHFDDYFYPSTAKDIDKLQYSSYIKGGGELSLYDWRRSNVSSMIRRVYSAIKKENLDVKFGISPAANIENNYSQLYADTATWCTDDGYLDYICPQVYYGFYNDAMPFMSTVKKWSRLSTKDLYIGLPLYKCGKKDKYASSNNDRAILEFKKNDNVISRQINYIAKIYNIKGVYVFSYSCLFDKKNKAEVSRLKTALQNF